MNPTELLLGGSAWWILPCSLLVIGATFGLLPGLLLRLIVLLYPKGHPRREELFGELYDPDMGRMERFEWVFQQLETAVRQGPALRRRARIKNERRYVEYKASEDMDLLTALQIELKRRQRPGADLDAEFAWVVEDGAGTRQFTIAADTQTGKAREATIDIILNIIDPRRWRGRR